ncbi:molybdate ABC transporter substrate-binding protein [Paucisalibacillus sp. EB02]|uniref:molybdate ABC transporter substrate-binding protein n=1 Tax=Paucisalibacillus sp. EB02 TaxID=1347087 RepID=UPI0004B91E98|nr:molybdate ABC transporter substrate-binding protein [Paucisalibacillus sp. EB02]
MRTYLIRIFLIILILVLVTGCSANNPLESSSTDTVELTISAAASLKESLGKIQHEYELNHPHVKLKFNFGGSGSLKQQITQGAPVDLFFSAAEDKFNELVKEGLIAKEDGNTLLTNELVLIVPSNNPMDIAGLEDLIHKDVDHISIGIPETVPAGKYAKESLTIQDLWQRLESKIVPAKDVRQVLYYVETGNVAAGIVYYTDALSSNKVTIIHTIDSSTHTPIHYPIGIIKETNNYEAAKDFYDYLQSDEALGVFKRNGFIPK